MRKKFQFGQSKKKCSPRSKGIPLNVTEHPLPSVIKKKKRKHDSISVNQNYPFPWHIYGAMCEVQC